MLVEMKIYYEGGKCTFGIYLLCGYSSHRFDRLVNCAKDGVYFSTESKVVEEKGSAIMEAEKKMRFDGGKRDT